MVWEDFKWVASSAICAMICKQVGTVSIIYIVYYFVSFDHITSCSSICQGREVELSDTLSGYSRCFNSGMYFAARL